MAIRPEGTVGGPRSETGAGVISTAHEARRETANLVNAARQLMAADEWSLEACELGSRLARLPGAVRTRTCATGSQ